MWRCQISISMSHADRRFWATEIRCAGNRPSVEAINSPENIQHTIATRWCCVNPHAGLSYIDMHAHTYKILQIYTKHKSEYYINLYYTYIIHIYDTSYVLIEFDRYAQHCTAILVHSRRTLCPKSIAQNAQGSPEGGPVAAQGMTGWSSDVLSGPQHHPTFVIYCYLL